MCKFFHVYNRLLLKESKLKRFISEEYNRGFKKVGSESVALTTL